MQNPTTAGEALNYEIIKQFKEKTGLQIMEGFGQTETTAILINQAGSAIKTYCQIMGVDTLLNEISKHDYSFNSNYATLLESYKRKGVAVDRDLLFDQYGYLLDNLPFTDSELDHVFSFNDYVD